MADDTDQPPIGDDSWVHRVLGTPGAADAQGAPASPDSPAVVPPPPHVPPRFVPPQNRPPQYAQQQQQIPQQSYPQPQYPQPQYQQPRFQQPQYQQPHYPQSPGAFPPRPQARKSSTGLVLGIVAGALVAVFVVGAALVQTVTSIAGIYNDEPVTISTPYPSTEPGPVDTEPDPIPEPDLPIEEEPEPVPDPVSVDAGERFRLGEFATDLPKVDRKAVYTGFTNKQKNATKWLYAGSNLPEGIEVVFTADPKFNCALAAGIVSKKDKGAVAGCYNPTYYKTIFMWWGTDADEYLKQFILLHELSHFYQWWDYYDTMTSGYEAGIFDSAHNQQVIIESDATCRVVKQWKWEEVPTASPCKAKKWNADWLTKVVKSKGVKIIDW